MKERDTEQVVDILVVIDVEGLMAQYGGRGSPSSPYGLAPDTGLLYMFVKHRDVVCGQASAGLVAAASANNVIRWRAVSLTVNTRYSAMLYACAATGGSGQISPPQCLPVDVTAAIPVLSGGITGDVVRTDTQPFTDSYIQAIAALPGDVDYRCSFLVTDSEGEPHGYFSWDTRLVINRNS
jgi:hypothetical protein